MYACAGCGLAVIVADGTVIRACTCEAAVVGNLSSTLEGSGGVRS